MRLVPGGVEELRQRTRERERQHRHRAGFEEGRLAALEGPARALEEAAERYAELLRSADEELAREAVRLSLVIARQLVAVAINADTHDVEKIVREALAASGGGRGPCQVRLHPQDLAMLEGVRFRADTALEEDPEIPRGHVSVTTPEGTLVRDLDRMTTEIGDRILGELR